MPVPEPERWRHEVRFQSALNAIRNPGFLKSAKYQEQQKRANRNGAHPLILEFTDKLVKRLAGLGVPVFPHCIVRTREEQAATFAAGRSWVSPEDGMWPHRFAAVDIIHSQFGWMDQPVIPHAWEIIGHIGKEVASSLNLKVVWGGDWPKKADPAHWELDGWRYMDRANFKASMVDAMARVLDVER